MIALITPFIANLFLVLWIAGLIVLWLSTRKNPPVRKTGIIFLAAVWLLGTKSVAELILKPLENQYKTPEIKTLKELGVNQVVVLTGGGFPASGELLSSALPPCFLIPLYQRTGVGRQARAKLRNYLLRDCRKAKP